MPSPMPLVEPVTIADLPLSAPLDMAVASALDPDRCAEV